MTVHSSALRNPTVGGEAPPLDSPTSEVIHAESARGAQAEQREKIRFVCAPRHSAEEFFSKSPLGRSLPLYRTFPRDQPIELRLFKNNTEGLSAVYNVAIEEARA